MKIGAIWASAALIGSTTVFFQPKPQSHLEMSCAPTQIQDGPQVARLNFCQTSAEIGRMTVLMNNGFGQATSEMLNSRTASLHLSPTDSQVRAQSGDYVIEAKPVEGQEKSWQGILRKGPTAKSEMLSCRIEMVSNCENSND